MEECAEMPRHIAMIYTVQWTDSWYGCIVYTRGVSIPRGQATILYLLFPGISLYVQQQRLQLE